jgi:hypothetical protein
MVQGPHGNSAEDRENAIDQGIRKGESADNPLADIKHVFARSHRSPFKNVFFLHRTGFEFR